MMREPVFAQQGWYPSDPDSLRAAVQQLTPADVEAERCLGVMSPHAGYRYSGGVAGALFARVVVPERVIVLCVNHRGYGRPSAVWPEGHWMIPGAAIPIDEPMVAALLGGTRLLRADAVAHRYEHSGELQLPFLHARNPALRITVVSLRHLDLDDALTIGDAVAGAVREAGEDVLIVASSDMNHFESAAVTLQKDAVALERLTALDPGGLYRVVSEQGITMCGVIPTVIMLQAAIALGASRATVVSHTHSGAITGDDAEVVGYAGVMVQ